MLNKISLVFIFIILSIVTVSAQVMVDAVVDADSYEIDETVTVSVYISGNTGLHGIYFDMEYDSEVFHFEEIVDGVLSGGFPHNGELLYADNPFNAGNTAHPHIIASYAMKGRDVEIYNNGLLMQIKFRVLKQGVNPTFSYRFNFTANGVVNGDGTPVTGVSWNSSSYFQIDSPYDGAAISIENPYYYQVLSKSDVVVSVVDEEEVLHCAVDTIFTEGNFHVKIYNEEDTGSTHDFISAASGYLLDTSVIIYSGFNTIAAELYTQENERIAVTRSIVYLAPENEFVKIVSPGNHAFVNSDMAVIQVESPYDNVLVNHLPANLISESNGIKKYEVYIWLTQGFNKITAQAAGPGDIIYKDQIEIYYRKDSQHFNLISPAANENFRDSMELSVRGTIGSQYKFDDNSQGHVENNITIDVYFEPDDYTKQDLHIVRDQRASISNTAVDANNIRAKYVFQNTELISLEGYGNGTLRIEVYKNREGDSYDDKITRICYVNNNRLYIDLVQPDLYSEEILDTWIKFDSFDENQDLDALYGADQLSGNIGINKQGALYLSDSVLTGNILPSQNGIVDIEEAWNGVLYALKNVNGSLIIYEKLPQELQWKELINQSGLYGFDLQYTDKGLFVGVADLYSSEDDGLYLLDNGVLKNVDLPVPLPNVQFLNYQNNSLYMYGNYYTNMYSFDVFTIEEQDNTLNVAGLTSTAFETNVNIRQFILTKDNTTAIIRTELNEIFFYKKLDSGFNLINMDPLNGSSAVTGEYIISGEYSRGDYETFFILKGGDDSEVIMKNIQTRLYYRFETKISDLLNNASIDDLYGTFKDDNFHFLYKSGTTYQYTAGQIFFDKIYSVENKVLTNLDVSEKVNSPGLFIAPGETFYFNYGFKINNTIHTDPLAAFFYEYNSFGSCEFNYQNDDITGIRGFSFEVESKWIDKSENPADSPVSVGFSIMNENDVIVSDYSISLIQLNEFIKTENGNFKVTSHYDSFIQKYIVYVEFNDLQEDGRYLKLNVHLDPVGNITPEIYNITITKKVPVVLTIDREESENTMILPIHGYIQDRTVENVFIQNNKIPLERDGSFFFNYTVRSVLSSIDVDVFCINGAGETARADFTVNIMESANGLADVEFFNEPGDVNVVETVGGKYVVQQQCLHISAKFYALEGAILGYKVLSLDPENPQVLFSGLLTEDLSGDDEEIYQFFQIDNLGPGYKAGIIDNVKIPLAPGDQQLIIYCENPGGRRAEFLINQGYPIVNYNMSVDDQKILYTMETEISDITSSIPIVRTVSISAYETGQSPDYLFKRDYTISGEIKTLYNTNLIVKSLTSGVLFENGLNQITVELLPGNRFSIPLTVTMDSSIEKDFDIAFIPDSPLLTNIRSGVRLSVSKFFEHTNFIPDFSEIREANITDNQGEHAKLPVKLAFNRDDIPLPRYTFAEFICNYETRIAGWITVDPDNPGYYTIVDDNNQKQYITGIKPGINRLTWTLQFKDPIGGFVTMSSSSFADSEMREHFFDYSGNEISEPTEIAFAEPLTDKFYGTGINVGAIPLLNISKDKKTDFNVYINGRKLVFETGDWTADVSKETLIDYSFIPEYLLQGRNTIDFIYTELLQLTETKSFTFLYDNKKPLVVIESYIYDDNYEILEEVTFYVTEANYAMADLHFGVNILDIIPEVEIVSTDTYRLVYRGLSLDTGEYDLNVKVFDLTGKSRTSGNVPTLKEIADRPNSDFIREVDILLPRFNNVPDNIANESGNQAFPDHTKFSPERFLERINVTKEITDNNGVLIDNFEMQKIQVIESISHYSLGSNVAIDNDYMVFAAVHDDENGHSSGSVYIYHLENGIWGSEQKITASDGAAYDFFGCSVAIYNDYMVVGSHGDDDNGKFSGLVYIYHLEDGIWGGEQKITASDGAAEDRFGDSVVIDDNYMVVGSTGDDDNGGLSGSVYIYHLEAGIWGSEQKITASDGAASDDFGYSVAIDNNYMVVGSYRDDDKGNASGSVYIYHLEAGIWGSEQKITASDGSASDSFGYSVAIDNNYMIVGSRNDDDNGFDSGSVYIYHLETGIWGSEQKITASDGALDDDFGFSVEINNVSIVVGAKGDEKSSGSVYVYHLENEIWGSEQKITASDGASGDYFGYGVGINNDSIVVGAEYDDYDGYSSGSAYVYSIDSTQETKLLFNENNNKYMVFKVPIVSGLTFADFNNSINFEVYGKKQNKTTNEISEVKTMVPFTLDSEIYRYYEGISNYYFIVNIESLESELEPLIENTNPNIILFAGISLDDFFITDSGSLRIIYDDEKLDGQRPSEFYLTGNSDSTPPKTFWDDLRFYDTAYEGVLEHDYINSAVENTDGSYTHIRSQAAGESTLYFWLRPEDEGLGTDSFTKMYEGDSYRRVLTLPGLHLGYRNNQLQVYKNGSNDPIFPSVNNPNIYVNSNDSWNHICFNIASNFVSLYINGLAVADLELTEDEIKALLSPGAEYVFGPEFILNPTENNFYKAGFFSLARPVYINRLLTDAEILRLAILGNGIEGRERNYRFSDGISDFGDSDYDLRLVNTESTDYFKTDQNADWTEVLGHGSFKASEEMENLFVVHELDTNKNCVILRNASLYTRIGVDVTAEQDQFTISPKGVSGRYYFGNRNGNAGLKTNRWYSISGTVLSLEDSAKLVLRINNQEQYLDLNEGEFQFIYENIDMAAPSEMNVYIETTGNITIKTDLVFNEGNFILPENMEESAASTKFAFGRSGTIDFWYKPFNVNNQGEVNYSSVLVDSEYLTIGTTSTDHNTADYYIAIKEETEIWKTISTNVKVAYGWQYLQVSYDYDSDVLYFYINGLIAAFIEEPLPEAFGSIIGFIPEDDNVRIGCNLEESIFANGYIDDFYIGKYYSLSKYEGVKDRFRIFTTVYNTDENLIELEFIKPEIEAEISSVIYNIKTIAGIQIKAGNLSDFPLDTSNYPGGRYVIDSYLTINGHEYFNKYTFNLNNRPRFMLKEQTPIVFSGNTSSVAFKFSYDRSYQFATEAVIFTGIAAKIIYNSSDEQYAYIVQDFQAQDKTKWLLGRQSDGTGPLTWSPITMDNGGLLSINFNDIISETDITSEFKYFYFESIFSANEYFSNAGNVIEEAVVPAAVLNAEKRSNNSKEYKIDIDLGSPANSSSLDSSLFDNMKIICEVERITGGETQVTTHSINKTGQLALYYDDILIRNPDGPLYGNYNCTIKLNYFGSTILTNEMESELIWEIVDIEINPELRELEIDEFSILYMEKIPGALNSNASFLLKYNTRTVEGITGFIELIDSNENVVLTSSNENLSHQFDENIYVFENIEIPLGQYRVQVTLSAEEFLKTASMEVRNDAQAPEVVLTNGVTSRISHNNVFFSWKGYFDGLFNADIEYSYQFDRAGWSEVNNEWRSSRFFNLEEGYHIFEVKAIYNDKESYIVSRTFFVDINRPLFHDEKITIQEICENNDILSKVKIMGNPGAVEDISLDELYINGEALSFNKEDGSFVSNEILLLNDGDNKITITAYDKVGNFTDFDIHVDNTITTIRFPDTNVPVVYSPLTIVGEIAGEITSDMEIFLQDPFTPDSNDYSSWKKAKINEDKTFFIEDVLINPGTDHSRMISTLKLVTVFASGETFEREINVGAYNIVMPIEISLNTHAAEGENEDTYVEIVCNANVENISSWSVDYNGDGIYDEIDLVSNPLSVDAMSHSWSHKYSSLQRFFPRVRVITIEGNFFSVSDSLIVHEKIKDASPNLVINPVSVSAVTTNLQTQKVFILRQENLDDVVDIYFIPRYDARLINTGEIINLSALNISDSFLIEALDEDNLFIVSNKDGIGTLYQAAANAFGNYVKTEMLQLSGEISDIVLDENNIFISFKHTNKFVKVDVVDNVMITDSAAEFLIDTQYTSTMGANCHLALNRAGLIISDYENHRILKVNRDFELLEQFGSLGNEGGEFISPDCITAYGERILVYDERREDVQVFDTEFQQQCTLTYNPAPDYHNYVESGFFTDLVDIDVIAKETGDRLYYYALVLSKSSGMLSFLKLPQYEELRARVRNNRVVFIKDGEIFTSKPDGSDMLRTLSSDSIPRIEGTLDYPALSPDGRNLVFTSRVRLYNSGYYNNLGEENIYDYDNVYTLNIETQELVKFDLGILNTYALERPVFNSNGNKIIFSAKEPGEKWQIWVYDLETEDVSRLFTSDENARFPYYSPDDRYVVFTTDYDGDEDIEIVDTQNTTMRVVVTANFARDSLPVWSTTYPEEISNPDYHVESKIAFVSEKDFHKSVYVVYIANPDESDLRIFNIKTKTDGGNIEDAPVEITSEEVEGDYPCFTGDGINLFFEYFDGSKMALKRFDFTNPDNETEFLKEDPTFVYEDVELLYGARRPAGMKNTITNFEVVNRNGDQLNLTWDRYTENDIFYYIQLMEPKTGGGYKLIEKKVSSQEATNLLGLHLGYKYKVRVCIIENEKVVTASQWRDIRIPDVIARPSFEIDETNPYVVRFEGWAPESLEQTGWEYTWIIDNTPYPADESRNFSFEFATSGVKIVQLKVEGTSSTGPETAISEAFEINIISDIIPVFEPTISDDSASITLDAGGSLGEKIDWAATQWTISGPGDVPQQLSGVKREFDISKYNHRIYVTLVLTRIMVNGQGSTDRIELTRVVNIDPVGVIPVIDTQVSEADERTIIFDGSQSLGNINWPNAQWTIFANGMVLHQVNSVSSFLYTFPENNKQMLYSVSLIVPRKSDGMTETVSRIISIEAAPIEPDIESKIITTGEVDGNIILAKLVLDCTKSPGSNIDFSQAKWTLPLAGAHGEQPTQIGPTAVFNLNNIGKGTVIEVNLALAHRGSGDYKTVTRYISISSEELPVSELFINEEVTDSEDGKIVSLDIYKSTGGNIDLGNTAWVVNVPGTGPLNLRGPLVNVSVPALSEDSEISYTCTLYRYGGLVQTKHGTVDIEAERITPVISFNQLSDSQERFFEMNILNSEGANINWERTEWYIFDGGAAPVVKRGSSIAHYFPDQADALGYPVLVKMYHNNSSYPFIEYQSLNIEGSVIEPVITYSIDPEKPNKILFSAYDSTGTNISWSRTRWSFGDSSQPEGGGTVLHNFPAESEGTSYRVTMTLTRLAFNGALEENFTVTKEITVGADALRAVVKASVVDGFLILSAAESEGQNLQLDRSVWLFSGAGDSGSSSNNVQEGTMERSSTNLSMNSYWNNSTGANLTYSFGNFFSPIALEIYAKTAFGFNTGSGSTKVWDTYTPSDDYINGSNSFSTQNSHTGAVCRRSIDAGQQYCIVALTVYRQTGTGEMEVETVRVKIDLDKARANAGTTGVIYGN